MSPWGKSALGKLILGACGAQLGMLSALAVLTVLIVACGVCASLNILSLSLTRQVTGVRATPPPGEASAVASDQAGFLLAQVDLLLSQLGQFQNNVTAPAVLGQPMVQAGLSAVNLYSGPGLQYEAVGVLSPGENLEIVGRNVGSTWWLVASPNGTFAWVAAAPVTALNVNDTIPVVTTPSQLGQPAASVSGPPTVTPFPAATPTPTPPPGTPTPAAEVSRQFVEELPAYQRVKASLFVPPVSASISPDGSRIAMTERIKVYTIGVAGAHTDVWLEDNNVSGPLGWVVWSPDGQYLAFTVGYKNPKCRPCVSVALLHLTDGTLTFLKAPDNLYTDAPRWTQDGRLLVNVHPGEPASGTAYIYNIYGEGQPAEGVYILSTSHEGQKWFPWRPGRVWRANASERPDSYVGD